MSPEIVEVRRWLTKADNDLRTANAVLRERPPVTDTAAFHAQQAVEKLPKAYLVWRGFEFEKIHDLEALVDHCAKYDPAFLNLKLMVAPLTTYAVRFRYPGPADPTVAEVMAALKVVEELRSFVWARIPAETHP